MAISKKEVLAGLVGRVQQILDTGEMPPWQKPWIPEFGARSAPFNPVTGRAYAGLNRLDLTVTAALAGYPDPRWMGYRQAAAQGWQVRAGSHAATIHLPVEIRRGQDHDPAGDVAEGVPEAERGRGRVLLLFKRVPVFNAAQIEGIPPLEKVSPEQWRPKSAELDAVARQMGVTVHEVPRDRAVYLPDRDQIELPPRAAFPDQYGFDATRAHELAHASGHASRLKRDLGGAFGSRPYAAEEVTAEIGSFLLCQELGIPTPGDNPDLTAAQHAAYLASWARVLRDDPNALARAIDQGVKAAGYLSRSLEPAREGPVREPARAPDTRQVQTRGEWRSLDTDLGL